MAEGVSWCINFDISLINENFLITRSSVYKSLYSYSYTISNQKCKRKLEPSKSCPTPEIYCGLFSDLRRARCCCTLFLSTHPNPPYIRTRRRSLSDQVLTSEKLNLVQSRLSNDEHRKKASRGPEGRSNRAVLWLHNGREMVLSSPWLVTLSWFSTLSSFVYYPARTPAVPDILRLSRQDQLDRYLLHGSGDGSADFGG